MVTLTDINVGDIVNVEGCKSKITKIEPPVSVFVRNLDYPKGGWTSKIVYLDKIQINKN